ncbi:MAG: hypothetical protein PGN13_10520, partial [Patulibacter minatonensis]
GSFTTKPEPGAGKTRLPTPPASHDGSWRIGQLHAAGDVNGDGLADVIAYGTSIYLGRRGQPSSISASEPTIKLKTATNLLDAIPGRRPGRRRCRRPPRARVGDGGRSGGAPRERIAAQACRRRSTSTRCRACPACR